MLEFQACCSFMKVMSPMTSACTLRLASGAKLRLESKEVLLMVNVMSHSGENHTQGHLSIKELNIYI